MRKFTREQRCDAALICRRWRMEKGLSQYQAAKILETHAPIISLAESADHRCPKWLVATFLYGMGDL